MRNENVFQASLIRTIKNLLPGCIVLKLDPNYIQGIPDLLILYGVTWAALECKKNSSASHRPNQEYYINKMNSMSFASFVYPENVQQVLEDMISYFDHFNNIQFTENQFNMWKNSQKNLQMLVDNNCYIAVA